MSQRSSQSKHSLEEGETKAWLTVHYQPVSLFSLKRSDATSMAARSNLVPTPYAIKMALLKVLLENQGYEHQADFEAWIKQQFTWIRDLQIYISPPKRLVVNRSLCFDKFYQLKIKCPKIRCFISSSTIYRIIKQQTRDEHDCIKCFLVTANGLSIASSSVF
jgi:hypothetical protein